MRAFSSELIVAGKRERVARSAAGLLVRTEYSEGDDCRYRNDASEDDR
jgi:hypothetical protein